MPWRAGAKASVLGRVGWGRGVLSGSCLYSVTDLVAWASHFPFAELEFSQPKNKEVGLYWQFSNRFPLIIGTFLLSQNKF